MAAEAADDDYRQQATAINLSPAAKMRIILSLRAARRRRQLKRAGADYAYLIENRSFLASPDGQRYLESEELRLTLETLLSGSFEVALQAAFDESREQLVFRKTFPDPEFLRKLVE
ncbi:hypothetical protein AAVH_36719, partial [Aphelenchoides avenae]